MKKTTFPPGLTKNFSAIGQFARWAFVWCVIFPLTGGARADPQVISLCLEDGMAGKPLEHDCLRSLRHVVRHRQPDLLVPIEVKLRLRVVADLEVDVRPKFRDQLAGIL